MSDGRGADPSLWHVDDPLQRHLVGRVDHGPQVGEHVLHLSPLVEADAPHHRVRDATPDHDLLEHPALGIGAVEDGHLTEPVPDVLEVVELVGHHPRLVVLVLGLVVVDRLALSSFAPEMLGLALGVVGDDGVGGVEDGLGGPVVLVEYHHPGVGIVLLELEDVADVGAAEPVDALVGVADHAEVAVLLGEQPKQHVLGVVGVLVLVDQHMEEPVLVLGEDIGERTEELDRHHDEVVEVHGRRLEEPLLVEPVDVGDLLVVEAARLVPEGLEVDEPILCLRDLGADPASGESAWGRGRGRAHTSR